MFKIGLATAGVLVLTSTVFAITSILLSPAALSVQKGQSFSLKIAIDPQAVKNYTIKTELKYPADLLEVKSFSQDSGWLPLAQPGYDLIDNTNGVLVKTAGYPGGIASPVNFGSVLFYAKKNGQATIQTGAASLAFDANSQNVLGSVPAQSLITIVSPPPPPSVKKPVQKPTPSSEPEKIAPAAEPKKEESAEQVFAPEQQPIPQNFSVATPEKSASLLENITTLGTGNFWVGILFLMVIFTAIVFAVYKIIRSRRKIGS